MSMSGRPSADLQAAASLTPGQTLAGRYRVTGFLGQGTVGEVYEAEDLELNARIAVKILRPEIARDERVVRRFKQEIQLTHRVTHPNVCRTYDLVYHQNREGGSPDRVFLTMELLRGETLEDLLARQGRLQPVEALPIVRQIAGALKAAHAAGVVHRDLKSANVFLVTAPSGLRAVVNDFGLAWSEESEGATTLTATGELIGSPAYMAPEQVRGETATPATDIYSLGVVLFEMVTGELPFVGKSAFYTALKRLNEPAPSPRLRVPDLDPTWDGVILRCLERKPADRFATVDEVVGALAGEAAPPRRTEPPRGARPVRWLEGVAGLCLLLGTGGMALLAPRADAPAIAQPPSAAVSSRRPTVAVVGFENLSGDPRFDALETALVQGLPAELAAAPGLRPLAVEAVERARRDLALSDAPSLSQDTLARLHARLGADFVVTGSYLVGHEGRSIRYDLVIQDARSGATLATFKESGTEEDLQRTLSVLGERLRQALTGSAPPRSRTAAS